MYTPERGRYVTASRDIDVGECLIHEEAFVNILKFEESLTHCYNCHKDVSVNPLPCENCAAVVFCSTECRTKAESWYNCYDKQICSTCRFIDIFITHTYI